MRNDIEKLRNADDHTERTEMMSELMRKSRKSVEDSLRNVLSEEQFARLQQISMQRRGISAIHTDDVLQAKLELTEEQREKMSALARERGNAVRELSEMPASELRTSELREVLDGSKYSAELLGVLTDDQRKLWKEMVGEPFVDTRDRRNTASDGDDRPDRDSNRRTAVVYLLHMKASHAGEVLKHIGGVRSRPTEMRHSRQRLFGQLIEQESDSGRPSPIGLLQALHGGPVERGRSSNTVQTFANEGVNSIVVNGPHVAVESLQRILKSLDAAAGEYRGAIRVLDATDQSPSRIEDPSTRDRGEPQAASELVKELRLLREEMRKMRDSVNQQKGELKDEDRSAGQ